MARIRKFSPFLNLTNFQVFLIDELSTSRYFRINQLGNTFTGGKNGFIIEGSEHLKESTEVKIEILDVDGNPIYVEPGDGTPEYYEGVSKVVSCHVYDETPIGTGRITILGELKSYIDPVTRATVRIPDEWKGIYNVKWERDILINKNLNNETIVRFYRRPQVTITEFVKPIFTKSIPSVTQTGNVVGEAFTPPAGIDLRNWTAGTAYKLKIVDGGAWTASVDENIISVPSIGYEAKIIEVLNDTDVLTDTPYTVNNIISSFDTQSYSVTFANTENVSITNTDVVSSFAKIDITQLATFVGDVARLKIFRKSKNTAGDFILVQESKLESYEILKDVTTTSDIETNYGFFSQNILDTYWESGSDDHPVSVNNSVLNSSLKIDYDNVVGGIQRLQTTEELIINDDVEYTLSFRTVLSGSVDSNKTIRAYLSSSNFIQDIITISGSNQYITRENVTTNIISQNTGSAKLVFDFSGSDWYISNVSLRYASDTAFSPDEFSIIQNIPRKAESEIFDFRFEFYDINNNYIPVDVFASKEFDGGNDFASNARLLSIQSSQNAFRFSSGSLASPSFQQIQFTVSTSGVSGSLTFASSAFDESGVYINPALYSGDYPGQLTTVTANSALLTVANFTGSDPSFTVGSIIYTASIDSLESYQTIFRLQDGDNAPTLFVTSNANQFIYEPTTLSPKPAGQTINIRAQRKNLASLTTAITVNSSSVSGNPPPLTFVGTDTSSGISTWSITATAYSASNAAAAFPETTYSFTGSDVFGIEYSDEITISPVINFDGASVILTTENTTFQANSVGTVTSDAYDEGDGEVQLFIGNNQIVYSNGLSIPNSFDITNIASSSVGITPNSTTPSTNSYGVSTMSADSGSLTLSISYLAGDNTTQFDFTKRVNYTKARKAAPSVVANIDRQTQTITADASFTTFGTPLDITLSVFEGGSSYSYDATVTNPSSFYIISAMGATNNNNGTITPNTPTTSAGVSGTILYGYINSEGTNVFPLAFDFTVGVVAPGVSGSAGASGSKSFAGQVYYQISASSAPSAPSATSYTFSTGTFSGLTANWSSSPPIFSGSNGAKYWYSLFNAGEDTAGADIATSTNLVFQTPKQAIGFSGLVTFTGTDSISNGDGDALSFGAAGTTTINGDVITTGRIKSTNLDSGSLNPYTNTGTVLFLTDGAFHSEQFAIDSSGNASFKGTVTVGGTDLTEANTINTNDPLSSGGAVNYNPNFAIVGDDGRPAGIKAVYGNSAPTNISYSGSNEKTTLQVYHPSDTSIGAGFPAFKVDPNISYTVFVRAKVSTSVATSGFYVRMQEYDSELPSGITHISFDAASSEAGVVEASENFTELNIENVGLTTTYQDFITTYNPRKTAKWASLIFLNWTGLGTQRLFIDRAIVTPNPGSSLSDANIVLSQTMVMDAGRSLRKQAGAASWGNAQAYSKTSYTDGAIVSFILGNVTGSRYMMGLNQDPTTDANYTSIDFAFYVVNTVAGGTVTAYAYNGITNLGTGPTNLKEGDVCTVAYDGDKVRWAVNGTAFYTWDVASNLRLYFDSSFYTTAEYGKSHISWFDFKPYGQTNTSEKTGGKVAGWTISGDAISSNNLSGGGDGSYSTAGITMNNDGFISSPNFYLASNGNAAFRGTVTVGGTNLTTTNTLNANTTANDVGLGNVANLNAQGQAQSGLTTGTTITGGGITLNGGGRIRAGKTTVSSTSNGFWLGHDGASSYDFHIGDANNSLWWDGSAAKLTIKGTVTATAGSIGGWTVSSTELRSPGVSGGGNNAFSVTGTRLGSAGYISTPYFYAGTSGAEFKGTLAAATGNFSGSVTASDGRIGDWIIGTSSLLSVDTFNGESTMELDPILSAVVTRGKARDYDENGQAYVSVEQTVTYSKNSITFDKKSSANQAAYVSEFSGQLISIAGITLYTGSNGNAKFPGGSTHREWASVRVEPVYDITSVGLQGLAAGIIANVTSTNTFWPDDSVFKLTTMGILTNGILARGPAHFAIERVSTSFTILKNSTGVVYIATHSSGTITITLPPGPLYGRFFIFKKVSGGNIQLKGNTFADSFVDAGSPVTTLTISNIGTAAFVIWDGSFWQVMWLRF